jgi:hypothetical protein
VKHLTSVAGEYRSFQLGDEVCALCIYNLLLPMPSKAVVVQAGARWGDLAVRPRHPS